MQFMFSNKTDADGFITELIIRGIETEPVQTHKDSSITVNINVDKDDENLINGLCEDYNGVY